MVKKMFRLSLLGTIALLASCVDDTYDLANKELVTDVKIEGNTLALPLGSMRAIMLDSLINVDDLEFLKITNGVYGISMSDSLPIEVDIPTVKLSVPSQKHSSKIDFIEVDITEVDIEGVNAEPAVFAVPNVSLDDLNEKLPNLSSSVSASLVPDELKALFETIKSGVSLPFTPEYEFRSMAFPLSDVVACQMNYKLPEQIRSLSSIKLASRDEGVNSASGSLIQFNITHPGVLSDVAKSISFSVEFPEAFKLSLDKSAQDASKYRLVNAHTLEVDGLVAKGNATSIQFYIDELQGLEQFVDLATGVLSMDEEIKYAVEYKLDGKVRLTSDTNLDDFKFNVDMNLPLGFRDIEGETNDIRVDFNPIHMDFQAHFDNLQHVERIDSIMFDAHKSVLIFDTDMTGGFSPFLLKKGHALKLGFPEELIIDNALSVYPTKNDAQPKIVYDANEHAFYIYDLEVFAHSHWELALDRIVLKKPVVDGVLDIDVNAMVSAVDAQKNEVEYLDLAGVKLESLNSTLENLKQKQATFVMKKSHLSIEDAIIHTENVIAPLDTYTSFVLNEEIPHEIGRIESVGFVEDVPVCFEMKMDGLEKLDTEVHLDLHIALPSFLKLKSTNPNIVVKGDSLLVKADYQPNQNKPLAIELLCTGLDFMGDEFGYNGLEPKDSTNGKSYLSYEGEIAVLGDAYIDDMDFHSHVLQEVKDITIDVNISIDDIEVKNFSGLYRGEIERIEESFNLDLGDELAFLKDENNRITLAEPQIMIAFENTVSVPVDINLQLSGKDDNGNVIETSVISQVLHIEPAGFDALTGVITPRTTKLFITSDTSRVSMQGYQNVEIQNLARLLERMPSSIDLAVLPVVDKSVTHSIDLSKDVKFNGEYSVVIPFKFDDFHICYADTISNLQLDLGETLEMFSNISLAVKMNVKNTLPVGVSLSVKALNQQDVVIDDVSIDSLCIAAGDGSSILEATQSQQVKFAIKSKSGDLSALDKLAIKLEAAVDHTESGVALKQEQGLQLSDIVIEVSGDIETSLTEKK